MDGHKVVAELTSYGQETDAKPEGKIVEILGDMPEDPGADILICNAKGYDLPYMNFRRRSLNQADTWCAGCDQRGRYGWPDWILRYLADGYDRR